MLDDSLLVDRVFRLGFGCGLGEVERRPTITQPAN